MKITICLNNNQRVLSYISFEQINKISAVKISESKTKKNTKKVAEKFCFKQIKENCFFIFIKICGNKNPIEAIIY